MNGTPCLTGSLSQVCLKPIFAKVRICRVIVLRIVIDVVKNSPVLAQADKTNRLKASGFRSVYKKPTSFVEPLGDESVSIHIGHEVRLQCPAHVGIVAIVRLAREARS
ncbi:MAG: hypothetical protein ACI8VW_002732 [bacterium]|jgi:hypothetical protein